MNSLLEHGSCIWMLFARLCAEGIYIFIWKLYIWFSNVCLLCLRGCSNVCRTKNTHTHSRTNSDSSSANRAASSFCGHIFSFERLKSVGLCKVPPKKLLANRSLWIRLNFGRIYSLLPRRIGFKCIYEYKFLSQRDLETRVVHLHTCGWQRDCVLFHCVRMWWLRRIKRLI